MLDPSRVWDEDAHPWQDAAAIELDRMLPMPKARSCSTTPPTRRPSSA